MEISLKIRICLNCGNPIPTEKRGDAVYCRVSCKQRGWRFGGKKVLLISGKGNTETKK